MSALPTELRQTLDEAGYTPLSELGRGGMGVVLLCEQKSLKRNVAVKVLLPQHVDAEIIRRFQSEGRIFKELNHPNLVKLYAVWLEPPCPFLVFEYIADASTLVTSIQAKLERAAAWSLLRALLSALAYLHERQIVHRDIKPGNVLVDAHGAPRLIDLGLARQLDSTITRQTRDGAVLATPAYAPPEQLFGEDVGPSADVYSWALIAIELLSGTPVFSGPGADAVPPSIRLAQGVPQISNLVPGLNSLQSRLLTRCTSSDPNQRPASAVVALAELDKSMKAPMQTPVTAVLPVPARPSAPAAISAPRRTATLRPWWTAVAIVAGFAGLAFAVLRHSRLTPPASPASVGTPVATEVNLAVGPEGVALEGSCSPNSSIELRWLDGVAPRSSTQPGSASLRLKLETGMLASLEVHVADRTFVAAELLRPHLMRLLQMLDETDFKALHRRADALTARNAAKPEAVPERFLAAGLERELARMRGLVEPALDGGASPELQRRLLTRFWELEVLDAHLESRGRTPRIKARSALGSWSETAFNPRDPANPWNRARSGRDARVRDFRPLANGAPATDGEWMDASDRQSVMWTAPAPWDGTDAFFDWNQPQPPRPTRSYVMTVDCILDSNYVLEMELNSDLKIPFCAWIPPEKIPPQKVAARCRRLPEWAVKKGPARLRMGLRPYINPGRWITPYVGVISFLVPPPPSAGAPR